MIFIVKILREFGQTVNSNCPNHIHRPCRQHRDVKALTVVSLLHQKSESPVISATTRTNTANTTGIRSESNRIFFVF